MRRDLFLVALVLMLSAEVTSDDSGNKTQSVRGFSFDIFNQVRDESKNRCGRLVESRSPRIVGGIRASIADFPWIISLQREKTVWYGMKKYRHSCGASLLTGSWIVTAAHCIFGRDEPLKAVAGTDNLNFLYRAQTRNVIKTIVHPEFDNVIFDNDIALVKVNSPFVIDSKFSQVRTICLERDIPVEPYDMATICGFGANQFRKATRTHLYWTEIPIIDQVTCNRSFDGEITQNMICAGGMIYHKRDACSGDSGGPLQMEVEGHASLIGLVSFGNDCASKGYPGIYTRISLYYDWILSIIDEALIEP